MPYTLGIDYGTNSVRALVVDVRDGRELGAAVINYPSGKEGILLDPRDHNLARQHPGDYLFGLEFGGGCDRDWRRFHWIEPAAGRCAQRAAGGASGVAGESGGAVLAVEGSHRVPGGGANHAKGRKNEAAIHRKVRQYLFIRVVLEQDLAVFEGCAGGF
jgi:hypothetical protein